MPFNVVPLFNTPRQAYEYAKEGGKRTRELERLIATDTDDSYLYAVNVLDGRFKLGEATIATDSRRAYMYAVNVFQGRFELGEPAIENDLWWSDQYYDFLEKDLAPNPS